MSGFSRKKCVIFFGGSILFILICTVCLLCNAGYQYKDTLFVSKESGIYDHGTELTITSYRKGTIYYSVNGEEPAVYEEPIILSAGEHGQWYHIWYYCVYADGTESEDAEKTYFVTNYEKKPVTTDYIVSITGNEEQFFGDEEGLFVRGTQFEEYMAANPDADVLNEIIPANYLSNEEIGVHAVIFDKNGVCFTDLNCGLKIYGAITRAKNQKSFRLIARYTYEEANSFDNVFLPKLTNAAGGEILKYKRLSFHNSGNDNGYGFIRNQLCCELARQAGYQDTLVSKSAAVYINNHYMGVYWLQNAFDESYFQEKYGEYNGEMMVVEGTLSEAKAAEDKPETQPYVEQYNEFCRWVAEADVQEDSVWKRISDTLDLDSFLQYAAIEYYVNNTDWPHNNVKAYQYVPADGKYQQGTVFDGKYRYLVYDLDYGMGLMFLGRFGMEAATPRLSQLCTSDSAALLGRVLERAEAREQFAGYMLNLINGSFALENVRTVLETFNVSRWNELAYMMEQTDILKDSLWESDDNNTDNVRRELAEILQYAEQRPDFVMQEMHELWNTGEPVYITCLEEENVTVQINGLREQQTESYVCFGKVPVQIGLNGNQGIKARGYYVNGIYVEGEVITILPEKYAVNSEIEIIPDYTEEKVESLIIAAFRTSGTEDYVTLENNGNTDISLNEYYLSDEEADLYKQQLPDYTLKPGASVTFYGETEDRRKQAKADSLSFSWKEGEKVLLSHVSQGLIQKGFLGFDDENCIDNSEK